MGQFLFTIFLNDIFLNNHVSICNYAEDSTIVSTKSYFNFKIRSLEMSAVKFNLVWWQPDESKPRNVSYFGSSAVLYDYI